MSHIFVTAGVAQSCSGTAAARPSPAAAAVLVVLVVMELRELIP